jgi:hypothetical protein
MKMALWTLCTILVFSCAGANAQQTATYNISNGAVLKRTGPFALSADPCSKAKQTFTLQIEANGLDTSYVTGVWPPGIDVQTTNALGVASVSNVVLAGNSLNLTLEALSDGTIVSQTSGTSTSQVCVGGRSAYIEVTVIEHYSIAQSSGASYRSPKPDVRLAFDFNLLKTAAAGFVYYKIGQWIRLGEAPWYCGNTSPFFVILKDPPRLAATGYLNVDGSYGTSLNLVATVRAEIDNCAGGPQVNGQAILGTIVGPFGGGNLPINGSVNLNFAGIFNRTFPLQFNIPVPSFASIPIDLPPTQGVTLQFGTFDGTTFTPSATPTHRDIPITINLGSFGGAANDNGIFIVDATVGKPRSVELTTPNDANTYFTSDRPIWDQRNLGVTVRDTFFGSAGGGQQSTGILGNLLPIRIEGDTVGSFHKHFEVVFDGASVAFVKHSGGDAISVSLTSTYAKIGNGPPLIGHGKPLNKIKASILLDRIVAKNGELKFRVADFRITISSWFFIFPIKLSSGQLEQSLNDGEIPLTGNVNLEMDLPICIYTGFDKFISPPNTCNPAPWFDYLGYMSGPPKAIFTIDPSTIIIRFNKAQVGGQAWQGLQAGVQVKLTQ